MHNDLPLDEQLLIEKQNAQKAIALFLRENNWHFEKGQFLPKEEAWEALQKYIHNPYDNEDQTYHITTEHNEHLMTFVVTKNPLSLSLFVEQLIALPTDPQSFKKNIIDQAYFSYEAEASQETTQESFHAFRNSVVHYFDLEKKNFEQKQQPRNAHKSSSFLPRWLQRVLHAFVRLFSLKKANQWWPDVAEPKPDLQTNDGDAKGSLRVGLNQNDPVHQGASFHSSANLSKTHLVPQAEVGNEEQREPTTPPSSRLNP